MAFVFFFFFFLFLLFFFFSFFFFFFFFHFFFTYGRRTRRFVLRGALPTQVIDRITAGPPPCQRFSYTFNWPIAALRYCIQRG